MDRTKLEKIANYKLLLLGLTIEKSTPEELELLIANLDSLISLLEPSTDVEKNYEFYKGIKKLVRKQ